MTVPVLTRVAGAVAVDAVFEGNMDPSMFVAYTPQTNGVPLESKLATYMVSFFYSCKLILSSHLTFENNLNFFFKFHMLIHTLSSKNEFEFIECKGHLLII